MEEGALITNPDPLNGSLTERAFFGEFHSF